MIIHIGGSKMIPDKEIMMILDAQVAKDSPSTQRFLDLLRQKECLENVSQDSVKSYVITGGSGGVMAYASSISAQTLYKRAENSVFGESDT